MGDVNCGETVQRPLNEINFEAMSQNFEEYWSGTMEGMTSGKAEEKLGNGGKITSSNIMI